MIQQARYLEEQLPPEQRTDIAPETIETEAEAAEYIREVEKRLRRRKKAAGA